jgi:acid phosphatase type 7
MHLQSSNRIRFALPMLLNIFAFGATAARADIITGPYLQAVGEKEITVMAECDSDAKATVDYGTTAAYGKTATTTAMLAPSSTAKKSKGAEQPSTEAAKSQVHRIKLTGLEPNTLYHYRVKQGATTSGDFTFRTAPPSGTTVRWAFLADFRTNTAIHDAIAERVLKIDKPAMLLYGGDLCGSSNYDSWKKEFFRPKEMALIGNVPFFNTPGNHEGWTQNTRAFTQQPGTGTDGYFSFDYGDMHILCVNYQVPYDAKSPQYAFAKKDLAETKKLWKIVFTHSPAYCSGGHGEDKKMKEMTTDIFEPNKVDMVLAGHTHFYQHNMVNGIHHMVIGSVGAPLYKPTQASYVVKMASDYCYGVFDMTPAKLTLNVFNDKGTLLEKIVLEKKAAGD